jgi:hypothetical protein
MGMENMEKKLDGIIEQQEELCHDVSQIKNTLQNFPRSWRRDETNGHKKWNDLCESVEELKQDQARWNKSAKWVIGLIGLGVATTVGLLVEDLYAEVTNGFFDRPKTKVELERDEYNARKKFIRNIEQGKFDGRLNQIEKIELKNENRQSVLKAIARRKHDINKREVD